MSILTLNHPPQAEACHDFCQTFPGGWTEIRKIL